MDAELCPHCHVFIARHDPRCPVAAPAVTETADLERTDEVLALATWMVEHLPKGEPVGQVWTLIRPVLALQAEAEYRAALAGSTDTEEG